MVSLLCAESTDELPCEARRDYAGRVFASSASEPFIGTSFDARDLQRSEQYLTLSQSRAHFFRQAKGRPQAAQSLVGRWSLE